MDKTYIDIAIEHYEKRIKKLEGENNERKFI